MQDYEQGFRLAIEAHFIVNIYVHVYCAIVIFITGDRVTELHVKTRYQPTVLLLDWSWFWGADSSDCLVEEIGVGLVVAAVTRSATTHELLLQTLGLFLTLFPVCSVFDNLSFHAGSRTYVAHPFLKSPPYPPPRLSTIIYFRPLSRLNGREIATVLREVDSLVRGSFTMADFEEKYWDDWNFLFLSH